MSDRVGAVTRKTAETQIEVRLDLDGRGKFVTETGIGFFDHMLSHIAKHGVFDLDVRATGDLHIDEHHTIEDCGIALGDALAQAVSDKAGLVRAGSAYMPLDEALGFAAVDSETHAHRDAFDPSLALGLGYSFTDKIGGFVELYADRPLEDSSKTNATFDFGATYLAAATLQLDAGVNLGVSDAATDQEFYVGVAKRF